MEATVNAERCAEMFAKCFGDSPEWIVAAPGRVNLIGEHTDYNDGYVLPMALNRYTLMAGSRSGERETVVHSDTNGETARFPVRAPILKGDPPWSNYVRGVVAGFQARRWRVPAFNAVIESGVPYGGGVSSSAALEVAAATLVECICGRTLEPIDKALLCQKAEHDFAGVPCGIMDQFTSVLARKDHALLLDCRTRSATLVPMSDPGITVLVVNTEVRHRLAEGEYAKRRAQCETAAKVLGVPALRDADPRSLEAARSRLDPVVFRRARHVVSENQRTLDMARSLNQADWAEVGRLMYSSQESLRGDYEVSCPELDAVVEIARNLGPDRGVIGCRMTGAGFGGCAVCLARTDAIPAITRAIDFQYESRTGRNASIFSTRPGAGARVLTA